MIRESLTNRQLKLALAWTEPYRDELMQDRKLAKTCQTPLPIDELGSGGTHMDYIPTVLQAVAGDDFTVYAYFSDGTLHLADIKPLIRKGGVFARLGERSFFEERLTVMNNAVAWDVTGDRDVTRRIDLDPWVMYANTPVVADPLGEEPSALHS